MKKMTREEFNELFIGSTNPTKKEKLGAVVGWVILAGYLVYLGCVIIQSIKEIKAIDSICYSDDSEEE